MLDSKFQPDALSFFERNQTNKILTPKHLIHQAAHEMDVFVGDLDEAGAGFVQQFLGDEQAVAEVAEVGVDAEFPGVAEGLDLFGFAGEVRRRRRP